LPEFLAGGPERDALLDHLRAIRREDQAKIQDQEHDHEQERLGTRGMRLYGLYLLVDGVLSLPAALAPAAMSAELHGTPLAWILAVRMGLSLLLGAVLFLGAPSILRWLAGKDERAALADDSPPPNRHAEVDGTAEP